MSKPKKYYNYGMKKGTYKGKEINAVILEDNTRVILYDRKLSLFFSRKKFEKIVRKQIKRNPKTDSIGITFDANELDAILRGFSKLLNKKVKKHANK